MNVNIDDSWKAQLKEEFEKPYFQSLVDFVKTEYNTQTCFPKGSEIFAAFDYCSFNDVKVVIIGQDPYHGIGQAHGLCFSVNDGIALPPSLIKLLELIRQVHIKVRVGNNLQML